MQTPYRTGGSRPPLGRPLEGRVLAGVCVGLAHHLRVHVRALRIGFVLAAVAGGIGLVVYGFLWAVMPEPAAGSTASTGSTCSTGRARPVPRRRLDERSLRTLLAGVFLVVVGVATFLQLQGLDLRLDVLIPMLVIGAGAVFAWSQLDDATRSRWVPREGPERGRAMTRLGVGVALAVLGLLTLATQGAGLAELWNITIAVLIVLAGVAFIMTPWALRLWNDLRTEQAERVRATERADIVAHLHDSVLQTLALIQRRSTDPAEVSRLARAQERELRTWLFDDGRGAEATLASAVTEAANEVEDVHGVPIELVVTGDHPLDQRGRALVQAVREALVNAVRHGAPPVSAYVEAGPTAVEAFVRDHGGGFDLDAVPPDRLGVRESILGRMRRHGGSAALRRRHDGTEVSLCLPVDRTAPPAARPDGIPDDVPRTGAAS